MFRWKMARDPSPSAADTRPWAWLRKGRGRQARLQQQECQGGEARAAGLSGLPKEQGRVLYSHNAVDGILQLHFALAASPVSLGRVNVDAQKRKEKRASNTATP